MFNGVASSIKCYFCWNWFWNILNIHINRGKTMVILQNKLVYKYISNKILWTPLWCVFSRPFLKGLMSSSVVLSMVLILLPTSKQTQANYYEMHRRSRWYFQKKSKGNKLSSDFLRLLFTPKIKVYHNFLWLFYDCLISG